MKKLILFVLLVVPFSLFATGYSSKSTENVKKKIVNIAELKQIFKTNVVDLENTLTKKTDVIETCSIAWGTMGQCPDGREYISSILWVEYDCETNELIDWGYEEFPSPC